MRKSSIPSAVLLALSLAAAVGGFFVRRAQLATELLADGSLAAGSRLHIVLTIVAAVFALAAAALLFPLEKRRCWRSFFRSSPALQLPLMIAAVLLAVGNVMLLQQRAEPVEAFTQSPALANTLSELVAPLGILSGVCFAVAGFFCLSQKKPSPALYMLACLYPIVRLVSCFQAWNTDPSIHDYCYQLLAAICTMLTFLQLGGFCFDKGRRRITLFWALCGIVFNGFSLADALNGGEAATPLVTVSLLLILLTNAVMLLFPDASAPAEPQPVAGQPNSEESNEEEETT